MRGAVSLYDLARRKMSVPASMWLNVWTRSLERGARPGIWLNGNAAKAAWTRTGPHERPEPLMKAGRSSSSRDLPAAMFPQRVAWCGVFHSSGKLDYLVTGDITNSAGAGQYSLQFWKCVGLSASGILPKSSFPTFPQLIQSITNLPREDIRRKALCDNYEDRNLHVGAGSGA